MAIGITEAVAELFSTSNSATYSLGAFTPTANAVLVVFASVTASVSGNYAMSGGSLTWHRLPLQIVVYWGGNWGPADEHHCEAFWAYTGASPGSTTITFDCSGDNATGCSMVCFSITGADLLTPGFAIDESGVVTDMSGPIRNWVANTGDASANPNTTFWGRRASDTNMETQNGYCYMVAMDRSAPAVTAPASWTEIADGGHSNPPAGAEAAYRAGGETGSSVTTTAASSNWFIALVEVYADGRGPTYKDPLGCSGMFGI